MTEAMLLSRQSIILFALMCALVLAGLEYREISSRGKHEETTGVTVVKDPVNFATRAFDPANPPPDMPPLRNSEYAECDSQFLSGATVGGETRQTDATHATMTITHVKVNLQLHITIWTPAGATQLIADHEDGHRHISEFYYQNADQVARRIAATYMDKQVDISGTDLNAESNKMLAQMATEITEEYNKELDPEPTQLLYDEITDHGRNGIIASAAAEHAIKNIGIETPTSGKS
jgi:hypothetical protein